MKKGLIILLLGYFFMEFSLLPFVFTSLHVVLVLFLLVSIVLVYEIEEVFGLLLFGGLLMEWFSVQPFGILLLSTSCALAVTYFLKQFLTSEPRRSGLLLVGFVAAYIMYSLGTRLFGQLMHLLSGKEMPRDGNVTDLSHLTTSLVLSFLLALLTYQIVAWQERTWGRSRFDIKVA